MYVAADHLPAGVKKLAEDNYPNDSYYGGYRSRSGNCATGSLYPDGKVNADGKVTYTDWKTTGRAVWNKVLLSKRHGYHVVIDGLVSKTDVMGDMRDATVKVKYVKD